MDRRAEITTIINRTLLICGFLSIQFACYSNSDDIKTIRNWEIPKLIEALKDKDPAIRSTAMMLLSEKYEDKDKITQWLIDQLHDEDSMVRMKAVIIFENKTKTCNVHPEILIALKDKSPDVRKAVLFLLAKRMEQNLAPYMMEALKDEDPEIRITALSTLRNLSTEYDIGLLPIAIESAKDENEKVRNMACQVIAFLADEYKNDMTVLMEKINDKDALVRRAVLCALVYSKKKDDNISNIIINGIKDSDSRVRIAVMHALRKQRNSILKNNNELFDILIKALEDKELEVRKEAVMLLGMIKNEKYQDIIIKMMKDVNYEVRLEAVNALSSSNKPEISNEIVKMLKDESSEVRLAAVKILKDINDKEIFRQIVGMMKVCDNNSQYNILKELISSKFMMENKNELIPHILKMLTERDKNIRLEAVKILGSRSWEDDRISSALIEALKNDKEEDVKISIVGLLIRKDCFNEKVIDEFEIILKSGNNNIRKEIIMGLSNTYSYDSWNLNEKCKQYVIYILMEVLKKNKNNEDSVNNHLILFLSRINDERLVPFFIEMMKDKNPDIRVKIVKVLGLKWGGPAASALLESLKDEDSRVRIEVISVLKRIMKADNRIIPAVADTLKDKDPKVRIMAINFFSEIKDKKIINEILSMIDDKDSEIRKNVVYFLKGADKGINNENIISCFLKALKDKDLNIREEAMFVLSGKYWNDSRVLDSFIETLKEESSKYIKIYTIRLFMKKEWQDDRIVPILIEMLKDNDIDVRLCAIKALSRQSDKRAIPLLGELLKDENARIRTEAASALLSIGGESACTALLNMEKDWWIEKILKNKNIDSSDEELVKKLSSDDNEAKFISIIALIKRGNKQVIPHLKKVIEERKDDNLLITAVKGIIAMEEESKAVSILESLLNDKNENIRETAAMGLWMRGNEKNIPIFMKLIKDKNKQVRKYALQAITKLSQYIDEENLFKIYSFLIKDENDEVRKNVVYDLSLKQDMKNIDKILGEVLQDKNRDIRVSAVDTLRMVKTKESTSLLIKTLQDEYSEIRLKAITELLTREEKSALEAVKSSLGDWNEEVKEKFAQYLFMYGTEKELPEVKELLNNKNDKIRLYAVKSLGRFGNESVIPLLKEILKTDKNDEVREWAKKALDLLSR